MLTERERDALRRWYAQPHVLERVRQLRDTADPEDVEEYLHKLCLFPLGKHDQLPDWMRTEEGKPLFETNLNPMVDQEKWQDAIEVGWEVMEEELGLSHDDIHRAVAREQQDEWEAFIASVEARKRDREKT